ncbi:dihydrolipoamide acetyltransferase family protein [Microbacterium gorillae]|uniref:dihydrolipoamide acetyltransferase family protein n=1 Tax=Microbacterium gorillae TaxID=1231063 RepID=UPI003D95CD70
MMIDILMPRLSDTMTEGAIAAWLKQPGDTVAPGDLLVEIETDKALMEQEAYDAGVLAEILVPVGENVPIGTTIARLDDGSGDVPAPAGAAPGVASSVGAVPVPDQGATATADASPLDTDTSPAAADSVGRSSSMPGSLATQSGGETHPTPVPADDLAPARLFATPLVRRLARERGIDLDAVAGSGPGGRVVRADLDELPVAPAAPASSAPAALAPDAREPEAVPFDAIREQIASRLTTSATTTPTFTVTATADVTDLLTLRADLNAQRTTDAPRVSVNDLLVRATALALRAHPGVNASYASEGRGATLVHGRVHIGIAVASPAGLVVPVIRDADRLAVSRIAATSSALVAKAAERRLTTTDMADGTFTISNLGMYGIDQFDAIINPPQGAILAVGAARDELALNDDGTVVTRRTMRLTLTADHRIIDGALAAAFLSTLTDVLRRPLAVLA